MQVSIFAHLAKHELNMEMVIFVASVKFVKKIIKTNGFAACLPRFVAESKLLLLQIQQIYCKRMSNLLICSGIKKTKQM